MGVLRKVVCPSGSWPRERRGGGISSDEGVERRDCISGGGGDKLELDFLESFNLALSVGFSFAIATTQQLEHMKQ